MNILKIDNWYIICFGAIIGVVIITNIVFSIVRKFINFEILKKHHELAGFIVSVLGVLYSVILGFTIVNSQQNLKNIVLQVDEEAYLSESLFQSAKIFPEKERAEIQDRVMAYIKSIIEEEWPLMKKKMESSLTLMKLEEMWRAFYNFQPKTEKEKMWYSRSVEFLLKQNSARLKRIYSTWQSIGILFWMALIVGGLILISFLFFFGTENILAHRLLISFFSGYFAFILVVIYALDNPFNEPIKLQPKAYQVIYNYDVKTRGTTISPEEVK